MPNRTITSANSVLTLFIPDLFPVPQALQGYATDDAFDFDAIEVSENVMGVDGKMSSGYVPQISKQTITLQADSDSITLFDFWLSAMQTTRDIIRAQGTLLLPGTDRSYVMTNGALQTSKQVPGAKKVLTPQSYVIAWESIRPAVV